MSKNPLAGKPRHFARLAASLCVAVALAPAARADVVTDWNATTISVLLANPTAQPSVHTAMVHLAIYDSVNAIDGRYTVYAIKPNADTKGASREAAAASAAYTVLRTLFPAQASMLESAYQASLAAVPDGPAEAKGIAIGQEVAAGIIALRANDGRNAVVPYTFGTGPGVYQRTPPAFGNPVMPYFAYVTPFALTRPSQFRAYGPPDLTSAQYAADLNAVKTLGALNSVERTAEQTEIALFHTESPTIFWARNLRDLATAKQLDVSKSARFYAEAFVSLTDATIACWDSKFYYNSWRPVTAIPAADTDGNPDTAADAAWMPLANTPPHPEYPAAHGCVAGAIATTVAKFFGTKHVTMTFTSTVPNTVPHVYEKTDDLVREIMLARVYGGMHFPTATKHGAALGKKVGDWVHQNFFRPVKRK